jgi:Peptidase A4 family
MPEKKMLKMSDAEVLKHIVCYDAPPADFDPSTAAAQVLRKHGIPRRPDAEKEPHLRRIWDKAFDSRPTFIKAEVAVDHTMSKRKRPLIDKKPGRVDFSPSGWAGAVVPVSQLNFNPPQPVNVVYGEWFIPNMTPIPNEPPQAQTVGFWVGIDGYGNGQVLQAGTAATISGTNVVYWVWTEWFPIKPIQVTNFPIKPGDYITVLVCAPQPDHGFCSMLNKTTNQATSIGINDPPPPNATSIGATAEWIVEGISSILPVFSTVVFSNVSAGTKDHAFNTSGGIIVEITGTGGSNLTAASITSPTSVLVKWLGSS